MKKPKKTTYPKPKKVSKTISYPTKAVAKIGEYIAKNVQRPSVKRLFMEDVMAGEEPLCARFNFVEGDFCPMGLLNRKAPPKGTFWSTSWTPYDLGDFSEIHTETLVLLNITNRDIEKFAEWWDTLSKEQAKEAVNLIWGKK